MMDSPKAPWKPQNDPPMVSGTTIKIAKTWNGSWNYMELLHSKLRFSQNAPSESIGWIWSPYTQVVLAPYPTKTSTLCRVSAKHTDEAFEMLKQSEVSKHQTGSWAAGPSEKKGHCMTLLY